MQVSGETLTVRLRSCSSRVALVLMLTGVAVHPRIGHAQVSWTGGGADGLWTSASNWSATLPGTGGTLVFSGTARTSGKNNAAVTSAELLSFTNDGTAAQTGSFTLSGSALSLTGATGIQTTAVTNGSLLLDTIALDLALASTTGTTTISTGASHNVRLAGVVSGAGGLTKSGAGTLFLVGANTFTGTTTVNAGTLNIWNGANLGPSSNPVVLDGGALELGSTYMANPITIGSFGGTVRTARNFTSSLTSSGLTGTGTLTVGGRGTLRMLEANSSFTGPVVIGNGNNGSLALRDAGTLTGVSLFTVNPSGTITLDDTGSTNVVSRISTTSTVALQGGNLTFLARNSAGNASATVGTVDASAVSGAAGAATITATKAGQGANLTIGNLVRGTGAGPVNFAGTTLSGASSGDISRVFLTQVNGAAVSGSSWLGGWATVNGSDFAAYVTPSGGGGGVVVPGSAGAPSYTTLSAASSPGSNGWAATNVGDLGATTGTMTIGTTGNGANFSLLALRTGTGAAAATLAFGATTGTPDTLYLGNGGLIHANSQPRHIGVSGGSAYQRGRLTAGDAALSGTAPVELFLYSAGNSQTNSLTVNSQVIDNPAGGGHPLTVFARGNNVTLTSSNSYSGGTQVVASVLTASVSGALGTGKATANGPGSWLILSATAASTFAGSYANPTYTAMNGGQISVQGTRSSSEFVSVDANSALVLAGSSGAWDIGVNLNLATGAIVAGSWVNANTLKNNGAALSTVTTPTWYYGMTSNQGITSGAVGAGTPWLGFAAPNAVTTANLTASTITLNGDIEMRGVSLGNGATGTEVLSFVTSRPTTISVTGATTLGTPNVSYGSVANPVTLLVAPGGSLALGNSANSLGVSGSVASVVVQNGGSFTFSAANNTTGINGPVTLQAGGRFVASGTGSGGITGTGQLTFENGSILEISGLNSPTAAWSNSQASAATINPGMIVRLGVANITNGATGPVDAILGGKAGVTGVTYELTGGSLANPASAATIMTLNASTGGLGGVLTNDSSARSLAATANGVIAIGSNGGGMAATTNTTLTVTEDFSLGANVLTLGSTNSIDGNPKFGVVQLNSTANTNTASAGSRIDVISGAALQLGAADQIPDATVLNLSGLFDMNKLTDTVAGLTGSGTVANGSNAASTLTIQGPGAANTFAGVIQNVTGAGSSTVGITITGSANQTLSGANTYTGVTTVSGGLLLLNSANALPGGIGSTGGNSGLTINGGVLGLGTGNSSFARALGTGSNQVQITGGGGFAAYGDTRTVNLGGSSGTATWGSGSFVTTAGGTFVLGAATADGMLDFQNPIALGASGITRTLRVDDGSGPIDAKLSGIISGSANLQKTGAGTLQLTAANTYTGTTAIDAGALQVGDGGLTGSIANTSPVSVSSGATLAFNRSDSLTYGGTLSGSGGLTKLGAGGLTLSAANTYTGATTISSGTLFTGVANAISGSSAITIGSAAGRGFLEIDHPLSISSLTFTGSGGEIVNGSSGTATFTATSGPATITVLSGSNYFHANASLSSPTVVNVSDNAFFSFHNNLFGGASLTKSGGGTMQLTGDGDQLSGNLFITGGRVNVGPGMSQLGTGTTTLSNGAILDLNGQSFTNFIDSAGGTILNSGGTATTTITGPTTVSSTASLLGTYSITSSGSGRFEGTVGNGSSLVTVRVNDGGGSGGRAVFANAVSGSANVTVYAGGTATFESTVAGYVISHGASAFSGSLLSGAEVQVQTGGAATFTAATAAGSTLAIASGGSATFDNVAATIAGGIQNSGTLTLNRTTGSQTISGALQGAGSLVKQGAGLVTIAGSNGSFQGPTTISAGTLAAATSTALGTGTVSIGSGGSLRLDPGAILANAITTTSTGSILFAGGGLQRTSNQSLSTVAQLVAGGTGASVALDPAFAWSARIVGVTYSDVLDLTNTHGTIQILQMSYDQSLLADASESDIFLGWNSLGSWVNAIDGNIGSPGGSALANANGGYAALGILPTAAYLGSWGRDTTNNTVWAVVNHNSEYAASIIVVPEPGTLGLAGLGVGLAGWSLWKRRRVARVRLG